MFTNAIVPQPTPPADRLPNPFEGTSGHEAVIATFLARVEQHARLECKQVGKRYTPKAFKHTLDRMVEILIADDLPF